jgi:hypothetical protein
MDIFVFFRCPISSICIPCSVTRLDQS